MSQLPLLPPAAPKKSEEETFSLPGKIKPFPDAAEKTTAPGPAVSTPEPSAPEPAVQPAPPEKQKKKRKSKKL